MRYIALAILVLCVVTPMAFGLSPELPKDQVQDQWRYVSYNSEWWYWLPEGRWVYWRNSQWNDFHPPTAVPTRSSGYAAGVGVASASGTQSAAPSEVRPFYGHAESSIDYGRSNEEEIGPFYGHTLPRGNVGFRSSLNSDNSDVGPFYDSAGSWFMY
jgi:hypothetical protein